MQTFSKKIQNNMITDGCGICFDYKDFPCGIAINVYDSVFTFQS